MAEEKKYNPRLTKNLEEFVKIMKNLNLPYPKQIGYLLLLFSMIIEFVIDLSYYFKKIFKFYRLIDSSQVLNSVQ